MAIITRRGVFDLVIIFGISLLAAVLLIGVIDIIYAQEVENPYLKYNSIWVKNPGGTYRQVSISFTETIKEDTGGVCNTYTGCYVWSWPIEGSEGIYYHPERVGWYALEGCTVWDHEILHAWGVSHAEMQHWFNCDPKMKTPLKVIQSLPKNYFPRTPTSGN